MNPFKDWTPEMVYEHNCRVANKTGRLSSNPVSEPNPCHESLATEARKRPDASRHSVRITSHRTRLCDERNLFDKYFTDALIYAGAIHGDSPKEIEISVTQQLVKSTAEQRTEITIQPLSESMGGQANG